MHVEQPDHARHLLARLSGSFDASALRIFVNQWLALVTTWNLSTTIVAFGNRSWPHPCSRPAMSWHHTSTLSQSSIRVCKPRRTSDWVLPQDVEQLRVLDVHDHAAQIALEQHVFVDAKHAWCLVAIVAAACDPRRI
jgi:hypothetical protein